MKIAETLHDFFLCSCNGKCVAIWLSYYCSANGRNNANDANSVNESWKQDLTAKIYGYSICLASRFCSTLSKCPQTWSDVIQHLFGRTSATTCLQSSPGSTLTYGAPFPSSFLCPLAANSSASDLLLRLTAFYVDFSYATFGKARY